MHYPQCNKNNVSVRIRKTPLVISRSGWWRLHREAGVNEVLLQLVLHLALATIHFLLVTVQSIQLPLHGNLVVHNLVPYGWVVLEVPGSL